MMQWPALPDNEQEVMPVLIDEEIEGYVLQYTGDGVLTAGIDLKAFIGEAPEYLKLAALRPGQLPFNRVVRAAVRRMLDRIDTIEAS